MNETKLVNDNNLCKNSLSESSKSYSVKTKSVNTSDYITKDSKNTTLLNFKQFLSNNYDLINEKEIVDFITIKPLLLELIKRLPPLSRQNFQIINCQWNLRKTRKF